MIAHSWGGAALPGERRMGWGVSMDARLRGLAGANTTRRHNKLFSEFEIGI